MSASIDRDVLRKMSLQRLMSRRKATTGYLVDSIATKLDLDKKNKENIRKRLPKILRGEKHVKQTVMDGEVKRKGGSYIRSLQAWDYKVKKRKRTRAKTSIPYAAAEVAKKTKIDLRKKVDRCLRIAKDQNFGEDVRYTYAERFFGLISRHPVPILTKNQRMKQFFEEMIANPTLYGDRVGERLRTSLKVSMARLTSDKSTSIWIRNKLYPQMTKVAEKKNISENIRVWVFWMLEIVGRLTPNLREDVEKKFLTMYWDKTLDPENKRAKVLSRTLSSLFSSDSESGKKAFLEGYLHLFSLPSELKQKLQRRQVSKKLIEIFKQNGYALSEQAQIRPVNSKEWKILDEKTEYTVKEDNNQLDTYLEGVIKMAKSSDQSTREKAERLLEACA